jgi:hypothetical protein
MGSLPRVLATWRLWGRSPARTSSLTAPKCLDAHATCSGVSPWLFWASTSTNGWPRHTRHTPHTPRHTHTHTDTHTHTHRHTSRRAAGSGRDTPPAPRRGVRWTEAPPHTRRYPTALHSAAAATHPPWPRSGCLGPRTAPPPSISLRRLRAQAHTGADIRTVPSRDTNVPTSPRPIHSIKASIAGRDTLVT